MNNEETITRYAIFNKHNGVLFTFEAEKDIAYSYNKDNFFVKEIILRPNEYFFGDYYTGKVYSEYDTPLIREDEEENKFLLRINQDYPVIKQILMIAMVIERNKDLFNLPEEFKDYIEDLKTRRKKFEHGLKAISENKSGYNFVSYEDLQNLMIKRVEGIT